MLVFSDDHDGSFDVNGISSTRTLLVQEAKVIQFLSTLHDHQDVSLPLM